MKELTIDVLDTIYGGETAPILTLHEIVTVYFGTAVVSNLLMSVMNVSPIHSFPISLFSGFAGVVGIHLYFSEANKNPA